MQPFITPSTRSLHRKGGAVIILALAMLLSLMFLGLFFFGFTQDEVESASAFAAQEDVHVDYGDILNFGIEQVVVGTTDEYPNSALYSSNGSYHSLLADILGTIDHNQKPTDVQPFSGNGLRVNGIPGGAGTLPDFEVDYDSTTKTSTGFVLNFSPGRNGGASPTDSFSPDDGTSYWDINSPFLAYDGYVVDVNRNVQRVVMPSFFVAGLFANKANVSDLYTNSTYAPQVFRPHSAHTPVTLPRYLTATSTNAQSGDTTRQLGPFPMAGPETGLYNNPGDTTAPYQFDVDIDGDGQTDSVYLDLDHPIVNLPGNRQAVPIFSVKILPLDGKLNVNAHGNIRGDNATYGVEPNGTISRSNDGISRDEINLAYALAADPQSTAHISGGAKTVLLGQYGLPSTATAAEVSEHEMRQVIEGRYGADGAPGLSGDDFPNDQTAGATFGQPVDYVGVGNWVGRDSALPASYQGGADRGLRRLLINTSGGGSTSPTPSYDLMQNSAYSASYQTNPGNYNADEGDETILEPAYVNGDDEIYQPAELFSLYASDALLSTSTSASSRLLSLAPFNLRDSLLASRSRKKLTTDSWDRLEFSMRQDSNRPWEFEASGSPWSVTVGGHTVTAHFPPKFDGATVGATTVPMDPFRPALRALLAQRLIEDGSTNTRLIRQRLNINRLLTGLDGARQGEPTYLTVFDDPNTASGRQQRQQMARDLYVLLYTFCGPEEIEGGLGADITKVNSTKATPPKGGKPPVPPGLAKKISAREIFDDTMLLEMAQFAVNVVDSLDPDDTTTIFEYDRDLGNGWNLDDDPLTDDNPSNDQRDFVYGVETQKLTLSESLFVYVKKTSGNDNHGATEFDESDDRSFAYIELQNMSDQTINFSNRVYQIQLQVYEKDASGAETERWVRYLTPITGTVGPGERFTIGTAGDDHNQNAGTPRPSYFRVDPAYDPNAMLPPNYQTVIPAAGSLNLDLITGGGFQLNDASWGNVTATLGALFPPAEAKKVDGDKSKAADAGRRFIRVNLRRRMEAGVVGPAPDANHNVTDSNHWITIDTMEIDPGSTNGGYGLFELANDSVPAATVVTKLQQLLSVEREQPLDRSNEGPFSPAAIVSNSLGSGNSNTPGTGFQLYQPLFNRDFLSVVELLSVPLYGPHETTSKLATGSQGKLVGDNTAAAKFLLPQHPSNRNTFAPPDGISSGGTIEPKLDNRWFRLLELVTVDHGLDALYRDSLLYRRRIWGGLCLNTIDDESALAGLIEDDMVQGFRDLSNPLANRFSQTTRNWYRQFLVARDGEDPRTAAAALGLPLPGLPGVGRPFVPFSQIHAAGADPNVVNQSIDQTLLRSHRAPESTEADFSPVGSAHFGLFEARDSTDYDATGDTANQNLVDYHTRQRILAKIANNTTTRNNLFVVWIRFDFFEAHTANDGGTPVVQIGSKIDDVHGATEFLVVDRTRLEEGLDANGKLNFAPFIIYRQRVQ